MESPIEKPFKCTTCHQSFTNEDHLQVHRKRHEMSLSLSLSSSDSNGKGIDAPPPEGFTDETPTPTRFFRISEEVGFFQDIQNVNPFDEQFARATSGGTPSDNGPFPLSLSTLCSNDTLNTPQVLGFPSSTPTPLVANSQPPRIAESRLKSPPSAASSAQNDISSVRNPPDKENASSNHLATLPSAPGKRSELLERNRAAALRSRERRKQWVTELEVKNRELMMLLGQAQGELRRLRLENTNLKQQLTLHSNCSVPEKGPLTVDPAVLGTPIVSPALISPKFKEQLPQGTSVLFSNPNTKPKRGRPRKGFEKRASLMFPPPTFTPPLKIQIMPLKFSSKAQPPPSPAATTVIDSGAT